MRKFWAIIFLGLGFCSGLFWYTRSLGATLPQSGQRQSAFLPAAYRPYRAFLEASAAAKAANTSTITMQFFGDVMLDRNVAARMGKRGLNYIFEFATGTSRFFGDADLTVINLEGAFAPERLASAKKYSFRFDPVLAPQLKKFGFSAVSLANNHSLDMGSKNLAFTRQLLAKNNIGYFGQQYTAGPEYNWVGGSSPLLSKEGVGGGLPSKIIPEKVALVGLDLTSGFNKSKMDAALKRANKDARYVIVMSHGGVEYARISSKQQRDAYRWLIDNGADAVIGHHPHVIQEAEIYKGKPIFYSLGNFIFDQYFSKDTQEGLSVGLILQDDQIISIHAIPFFSFNSQVFTMDDERLREFYTWLNKNSPDLASGQFVDGILNLQ